MCSAASVCECVILCNANFIWHCVQCAVCTASAGVWEEHRALTMQCNLSLRLRRFHSAEHFQLDDETSAGEYLESARETCIVNSPLVFTCFEAIRRYWFPNPNASNRLTLRSNRANSICKMKANQRLTLCRINANAKTINTKLSSPPMGATNWSLMTHSISLNEVA